MFGFGRRKAAGESRGRGFLSRLVRDSRGNTLAIVGAALIPLTAMIGSGVDMSRAYMAKTRLQMACDASALAARRIMANDTLTQSVTDEGVRFFNYNFNPGMYGTTAFTPSITRPSTGTIRVTASTNIPTTIMRMFGFTTLPLNVTCDAQLNFVNTDVMLVLDTTGSMDDDVNGAATTIDANRKITALRSAVMALYDQLAPVQTQLEANGLRLRYGIVPYSSSVNVGGLIRAVNPAYLTDTVTYQSRIANFTQTQYVANTPTSTAGEWEYYNNSNGAGSATPTTYVRSTSQCQTWVQTAQVNGGGPAPTATTRTTYRGSASSATYDATNDWGWTGAPVVAPNTNRSCRRWKTIETTTYATRYKQQVDTDGTTNSNSWTYQALTYDTSQYKLGSAGTAVAVATPNSNSIVTGTVATSGSYNIQALPSLLQGGDVPTGATWNGCIEERQTSSVINTGANTIPSNAWDLDINMIPTNDNSRWRPAWPGLIYYRSSSSSGNSIVSFGSTYYACPTEGKRLQAWTRADMQTYVNSLTPVGYTYHDIGMIWGARMLSNGGIFAADNPDTFNSMPVSRYIIFMTDGQMQPNCQAYTSYAIEQHDIRVTGSTSCSDQLNRHLVRFRMACNAARGMGYSVWVIAFGTTLSQDMINCASNPNQASTAADSATLIARFRQIGENIGALRLTQ